jgi:hypothetical protein
VPSSKCQSATSGDTLLGISGPFTIHCEYCTLQLPANWATEGVLQDMKLKWKFICAVGASVDSWFCVNKKQLVYCVCTCLHRPVYMFLFPTEDFCISQNIHSPHKKFWSRMCIWWLYLRIVVPRN